MPKRIVSPCLENVKYGASTEPGIHLPNTTAAISPMTPKTVASRIPFPGRSLYIQTPMMRANGMVIPIVNVPHALSASAFTTAKPSPASAIVTTNKMASERAGGERVGNIHDRDDHSVGSHH